METDQNQNWGAEAFRQPVEDEGDTVVFSEPGRILNETDYRSHSFKLVTGLFSGTFLLVRHGGGDERIELSYSRTFADAFTSLDSDSRYLMFFRFMAVSHDAQKESAEATAKVYRAAFVEGRLKKRKVRGSDLYQVSIERAGPRL